MEYVAARTPKTDREVYVPAEHGKEQLDGLEVLLEPALSRHDCALSALRERRIPKALAHVEEALRLVPQAPRITQPAVLMALQHDDYDLARRAVRRMERFGMDEAATFRSELEQRIQQWNAHVAQPAALREKYAAADPDASYRELLLLRERFGDSLMPREREHLHRWHIAVPASSQQNVTRSVLAGVVAVGLGMALHELWRQ